MLWTSKTPSNLLYRFVYSGKTSKCFDVLEIHLLITYSETKEDSSPILGVDASQISTACSCISATPSILGKTSSVAPTPTAKSSSEKDLLLLKQAVVSPLSFCKWWEMRCVNLSLMIWDDC